LQLTANVGQIDITNTVGREVAIVGIIWEAVGERHWQMVSKIR
jgi:hypothetical protein